MALIESDPNFRGGRTTDPNAPPDTSTPPPGTRPPGMWLNPRTGQYENPPPGYSVDPATGNLLDSAGNPVPAPITTGPVPGGRVTEPGAAPPPAPPAGAGGEGPPAAGPTGPTTGGGGGTPFPFSQPFTPPTGTNVLLNLPSYTPPPPFAAPTGASILQDPSYQFRLSQGLGALSNTQAAQGLWGTGAAGKAMQDYAQNFASQEYGNVYNRALTGYNENLTSQYLQPYQIAFQNVQADLAQRQQLYQNAFQFWLQQFQQKLGQGELGLQGASL